MQENNSNITEDLKKLAELREQGVLSEEEFRAGKARILGTEPPVASAELSKSSAESINEKRCRACQEPVSKKATKCPRCGTDLRSFLGRHPLISVLLVLLFAYWLNKPSQEERAFLQTKKEKAQAERARAMTFQFGQTGRTEKFEIGATFEIRQAVGGFLLTSTASTGASYVAVKISEKNVSNEPIGSFSLPRIKFVDGRGHVYDPEIGASVTFAGEALIDRKILSNLNPGITIFDAEVFEVSNELISLDDWKIRVEADEVIHFTKQTAGAVGTEPEEGAAPLDEEYETSASSYLESPDL